MQSWWFPYVMVLAVAIGAYAWLVLVLRLAGKRSLSKLNAFDFATTVAFGSALATVIIDDNVGILRGAIVLATLALLQYAVTKLSLCSKFFRDMVRSRPTLLVEGGQMLGAAMQYERVTSDELAEAIRERGFGRLAEVEAVVLETNGSFSVIGKSGAELDMLHDVRRISPTGGSRQGVE